MTLDSFIKKYRPQLETTLTEHLTAVKARSTYLPFLTQFLDILIPFATRGKMLRGLMVILGYTAFSKEPVESNIVETAAGIEIIHSALLIHDDIMDNDLMRRGQSSVYAIYEQEAHAKNLPSARFYGQAMGICAGDMGFFLGYELLAHASNDREVLQRITTLVSKELYAVGDAQMRDLYHSFESQSPTEKEIYAVYAYKTGRYTFSLPLMIGALQAQAPDSIVETIGSAAEKLGIVFQMIDDMIGLIGTEEEIGKPIGSDIRENKQTLIRHILFSRASHKEQEKLSSLFSNGKVTAEDISYILNLVNTHHVIEEVKDRAQRLTKEAMDILNTIEMKKDEKQIIQELADYNLMRAK